MFHRMILFTFKTIEAFLGTNSGASGESFVAIVALTAISKQ